MLTSVDGCATGRVACHIYNKICIAYCNFNFSIHFAGLHTLLLRLYSVFLFSAFALHCGIVGSPLPRSATGGPQITNCLSLASLLANSNSSNCSQSVSRAGQDRPGQARSVQARLGKQASQTFRAVGSLHLQFQSLLKFIESQALVCAHSVTKSMLMASNLPAGGKKANGM